MAFNITYKKSVIKDISRLDKKEARRIIDKIEADLSDGAESYPVLKGDFAGLRKMRVGDYRVVFTIIDNSVLVLRVGHRREIYKK
ncbi:MAG TPA: type II toxin-antitoxin system RelE/ParE family toxin [Smithellaceae bacterium]|nr:MAG: Plasmid stabilization system protein [Deltaproteobacteria bacterium ADurb.BinA014]HNQ18403.1 type II toxin-antitoxin system RelE/ParE family toxin [Smithellaceae bacterium]HNV64583.1 type II toxin-antitoxin system RelE/ParE family toxin [Smithellaceae bacterium]HNZ31823.1 type II toxin-antitoxin system RelE/ParE family toxin [Smithellaceae bacterium]HOZ62234.1 type II toxin-antitoxin system RelE/ParE family toxin [Smithellaceae bacterium]